MPFAVFSSPVIGGFVCLGHFLHAFLTGTKSLGRFQNP